MAEQTNHVFAAFSQLEVDNFPFYILRYSTGFHLGWKQVAGNVNNEVVSCCCFQRRSLTKFHSSHLVAGQSRFRAGSFSLLIRCVSVYLFQFIHVICIILSTHETASIVPYFFFN